MNQKVAYVTGGMGGIGTAICQQLHRQGFKVVAGCGLTRDYKKWLDEQAAQGFSFYASVADVADWQSTVDAFARVKEEHGGVDVLVNNAGITRDRMFLKMTREEWDAVINTNQIFALRLITALRRPAIAELVTRLQGRPGERHESPPQPPGGHWIICGNDALGKTLKRFLDYEGVDCTMIDPGLPSAPGQVRGLGTEAVTLREARIDRAQAIVAAYKSDSDNLSIAVTAKGMHPSLFVVGKQNHSADQRLFAVAGFDRVMAEADLIVSEVFPRIAQSLLSRFMKVLWHQDDAWGQRLLQRITQLTGEHNPHHFVLKVDTQRAPAIMNEMQSGRLLRLQSLWMLPNDPQTANDAIPLLLLRNQQEIVLPNAATSLQAGDQVLILYHREEIGWRMQRAARDEHELYYATHGRDKPISHFMNYLLKKLDP